MFCSTSSPKVMHGLTFPSSDLWWHCPGIWTFTWHSVTKYWSGKHETDHKFRGDLVTPVPSFFIHIYFTDRLNQNDNQLFYAACWLSEKLLDFIKCTDNVSPELKTPAASLFTQNLHCLCRETRLRVGGCSCGSGRSEHIEQQTFSHSRTVCGWRRFS